MPRPRKAKAEKDPGIVNKGGRPKGSGELWTEEVSIALANEMLEWFKADESHIFMQQFLVLEKGLYSDLVSDLCSKWPGFARIIKSCKAIQEVRLQRLALEKQNPAGSIFLLKNHHGYADKQEIKSQNVNYNYDPADLKAKTEDELLELLAQETNTTH